MTLTQYINAFYPNYRRPPNRYNGMPNYNNYDQYVYEPEVFDEYNDRRYGEHLAEEHMTEGNLAEDKLIDDDCIDPPGQMNLTTPNNSVENAKLETSIMQNVENGKVQNGKFEKSFAAKLPNFLTYNVNYDTIKLALIFLLLLYILYLVLWDKIRICCARFTACSEERDTEDRDDDEDEECNCC